MAKSYRGKAPLSLVLVGDAGTEASKYVQVYRGAPLPDGVSADELKRLEDGGFIEGGDIVAGLQADPVVTSRKA